MKILYGSVFAKKIYLSRQKKTFFSYAAHLCGNQSLKNVQRILLTTFCVKNMNADISLGAHNKYSKAINFQIIGPVFTIKNIAKTNRLLHTKLSCLCQHDYSQ